MKDRGLSSFNLGLFPPVKVFQYVDSSLTLRQKTVSLTTSETRWDMVRYFSFDVILDSPDSDSRFGFSTFVSFTRPYSKSPRRCKRFNLHKFPKDRCRQLTVSLQGLSLCSVFLFFFFCDSYSSFISPNIYGNI